MKANLDNMFKSDFLRLPRPFIRRFNVNTAIMLSEIYYEYMYWKERDGLQEGAAGSIARLRICTITRVLVGISN